MPSAQDIGPLVLIAYITLAGGVALGLAILVAREKRLFSGRINVGDPILAGFFFGVLVPAAIVAIFGAAATQANTGVYPVPSDYRNSADYVAWNLFLVEVVAPLVSAAGWIGLGCWLGVRFFLRRRRPTKSGSELQPSLDGGSGARRPVHSRAHRRPRGKRHVGGGV
jgi:hypothetical protein